MLVARFALLSELVSGFGKLVSDSSDKRTVVSLRLGSAWLAKKPVNDSSDRGRYDRRAAFVVRFLIFV